ncbi:ATP-binding protein [Endozoicomonas gorgoniicola]|uniref:histidine kinase n=1 Tax=Endozoicomonas gorgoniicola TaxID=1234144 RepID=A0ABT3MZK8_9GAMM|nr:ATP-binding protein [Endozoicomonas gorgoniicola]MCW7554805.1 ATP-binding protein [Endozoicomonas gorgoniicola]
MIKRFSKLRSSRFWPESLASQMILVVLLGMALALAISLWMAGDAHKEAVNRINQWMLTRQTATLAEVLEASPASLHRSILKTTRRENAFFRLSDQSLVPAGDYSPEEQMLIDRIAGSFDDPKPGRQVRVNLASDRSEEMTPPRRSKHWEERRGDRGHDRYKRRPNLLFLNVSIQLDDGQWLNMQSSTPKVMPLLAKRTAFLMGISTLCVLAGIIFMVRRITRPMRKLSSASHRLGLGEKIDSLQEEGPEDIRELIRAFNLMNERLQRFVADRTRMLAALSHDLRTPITSMRLRVELMEPGPDTDQLLATLDEMHQMSEATLAFTRQASDNEPTRAVDVNALLDSLCEDLRDIGLHVHYQDGQEVIAHCRLVSLKRAMRNLIENAVKYGSVAHVSTSAGQESAQIRIQDEGDGIPEAMTERVFEPFVRMEESRNRETGGIGLGMSIARNIIHSHGGDIHLENNDRGLLVTINLPLA